MEKKLFRLAFRRAKQKVRSAIGIAIRLFGAFFIINRKEEDAMFIHNSEAKSKACEQGVSRKVLCYAENLMMTEVTFQKGSQGNQHAHPHEQISYVAQGSFAFTIEGETKVLRKGDSAYIAPNEMHGVKALEDSVIVDVFTPMRQDFLKNK